MIYFNSHYISVKLSGFVFGVNVNGIIESPQKVHVTKEERIISHVLAQPLICAISDL